MFRRSGLLKKIFLLLSMGLQQACKNNAFLRCSRLLEAVFRKLKKNGKTLHLQRKMRYLYDLGIRIYHHIFNMIFF